MKKRKDILCFAGLFLVLLAIAAIADRFMSMGERSYSTIRWEADTLLVQRYESEEATLITDPEEIAALRAAYEWQNTHLECCMQEDRDFTVYAYRDGELVSALFGVDDMTHESYNTKFRRKLYNMGQRETNVFITELKVPSGVYPEHVTSRFPEVTLLPKDAWEAQGPTLTAETTIYYEGDQPEEAMEYAELGEYAQDDVFLPLQEALESEGVLRRTWEAHSSRSSSGRSGPCYYTREVTFEVTKKPSFDTFGELDLEYDEGGAWSAFLVSEEELSDADWAVLKEMGIKKVR